MRGVAATFRRRILRAIALLAVFTCFPKAHAQSAPFVIGFPIHDGSGNEVNPYTAPVISVVDHYASPFGKFDNNPFTVVTYTGEEGFFFCGPSGEPCGRYNPNFLSPLNGLSNLHFFVNGNYSGTSADGATSNEVLNYRGHSDFDYRYSEGTTIYAAHDGDLYIPVVDPILGPPIKYNTFYIRDASGWSTWYLHTQVGSVKTTAQPCTTRSLNGDACKSHFRRWNPIANVGAVGQIVLRNKNSTEKWEKT